MLSPTPRLRVPESPPEILSDRPKRKRKALSCYDCRRRKVSCDRKLPSCSRCRRAGQASSCSYDERYVDSEHNGLSTPQSIKQTATTPQGPLDWSVANPLAQVSQITRIENRLSTLEASQGSGTWQLLGEVSPVPKTSVQRPAVKADAKTFLSSPRESSPTETIIFRGENFRTQYYGGSNPTSLIAHFPELRSFMREAIMHHTSLPRVQRDLKALKVRWKGEKANVLPLTDHELLQLLPGRETVDHLVRLYFETFETIYRILHGPSFWKEYELFWEDPQAAGPSFIIMLFLIMAAVSCISLKVQPTYIGDSAMARERAVLWIDVSEWWLGRHSQKHIYLAIWQLRCLLILAKQVNIVKKKRSWTIAGSLVREAMSAGFHRDPSLLGAKASVFDQEMRRRLWATIIELELQASVDRGMPSASVGIPSDSATVLNVNDKDLGVGGGNPPRESPRTEYTDASFLHISRASFSLRVSLNSMVNDLSSPSRYEEVLNFEEMITEQLKKIPAWPVPGDDQELTSSPILARTLLDIQLRQFLILLYAPFARQAGTNPRYSLSRMICFNAAASILEQHSQLTNTRSYILLLLRHDYFRGALSICHNLYISMSVPNDLFLSSNNTVFVQHLDNALTMLEDRVTRLGTGFTHYWYISAACALIRSAMSPEQSAAQKQQAIDRVARQYYKVLASQEDSTKAKEKILPSRLNKTGLTEDPILFSGAGANPPGLSFLDGTIPQSTFIEGDLPMDEFYFGDPAAWTFDNLWGLE